LFKTPGDRALEWHRREPLPVPHGKDSFRFLKAATPQTERRETRRDGRTAHLDAIQMKMAGKSRANPIFFQELSSCLQIFLDTLCAIVAYVKPDTKTVLPDAETSGST
jgi:hypothetical protein